MAYCFEKAKKPVANKERNKIVPSITFCNGLDIKLVFTPFKIKSLFGAKYPISAAGFTIASHL